MVSGRGGGSSNVGGGVICDGSFNVEVVLEIVVVVVVAATGAEG